MARPTGLSEWTTTVSTHLPQLSKSQAAVLALWSYAIVFTQSCGLTTVTAFLAGLVDRRADAVRQQLREWYYEASAKRGAQRQTLAVAPCFAPLLRWVLAWWASAARRLVLALDATVLGQRFAVLAVAVVYRGTAIPVAWAIVRTGHPGAWRPHWEQLLDLLAPALPADWTVLVVADRGLYATWLFARIVAHGWHPFLRIKADGHFRPIAQRRFRPLPRAVPQVGRRYCGVVDCFATAAARLRCTLVAGWEAGHAEPWLLVTDLPVRQAEARWYGLRVWIEAMFKDLKRDGWQWQATRMTDPARAERLWLALAVATLWVVSVGGQVDTRLPASSLRVALAALPTPPPMPRRVSCFAQGWVRLLQAALRGERLPLGQLVPEPWPRRRAASRAILYRPVPARLYNTYP
jgi:hypothetical protein